MKITNEKAKCDNCQNECSIIESVSAVFGTPIWYLRCERCGCFYTSEDKKDWDLAWQNKPEKVKTGEQE